MQADLFAQMCYHGQNFDMSVPLPEGESLSEEHLLDLADRFHHQHESARGLRLPHPAAPRARHPPRPAGRHPQAPGAGPPGRRDPCRRCPHRRAAGAFGEGFVETATYDGAALGAGAVVEGPALIEEPFTVVVLAPSDVAVLDEHGNYDITIGAAG